MVYVVDDEPTLCELVVAILESDGLQVLSFTNPVHAVDFARNSGFPPSLLLTDFAMDPMNGLELISSMRKMIPDLRTILFSGMVRSDDLRGSPSKPDLFVPKPFVARDFLSQVRSMIP